MGSFQREEEKRRVRRKFFFLEGVLKEGGGGRVFRRRSRDKRREGFKIKGRDRRKSENVSILGRVVYMKGVGGGEVRKFKQRKGNVVNEGRRREERGERRGTKEG